LAKTNAIATELIAPCGMNCRLCVAFVREKNTCPGCRRGGRADSQYCVTCAIKNCEKLKATGAKYCFRCENFPCARLKRLDKRYRTRYGMSMIENLTCIRDRGIRHFIRNEKERRACPECGALICVHRPQCLSCGCQRPESSELKE
jgi:Protein of unknown function (DUF3795)